MNDKDIQNRAAFIIFYIVRKYSKRQIYHFNHFRCTTQWHFMPLNGHVTITSILLFPSSYIMPGSFGCSKNKSRHVHPHTLNALSTSFTCPVIDLLLLLC